MRSFFQLSFCLIVSAVQNATIVGPNYAKPLFDELRQAFQLSHPYKIDYVAITQATPANITSHLNASQPVVVNSLNGLPNGSVVIPMFGFPIAIVHNVPIESVNLSQSVLVDIFLGKIRWWNHTNLTDLNSDLPPGPITVVVGSLLNRVAEAMTIFAGRDISVTDVGDNSMNVLNFVCPTVKAIPFSIGFAWFGDALTENSQLVSLVNRDGYLSAPSIGVPSALSEYYLLKKYSPVGTNVQPHNMHGQFSWPLISFLYIVLPAQFHDCQQLVVVQNFISLVMFQTSNMDLLCEVMGWEPAKSLTLYGSTLGAVIATLDSRDTLNSLECGTEENLNYYSVGTSSQLATFVLKMLAPYTGETDADLRLLSTNSGINAYLDAMIDKSVDKSVVDMSFAWQPLLKNYPELLSVPVFMGSVVPYTHLPFPIILDRPTLVAIFSGVIRSWNDVQIQALNPGVTLPPEPITVFVGGGTVPDGPTAAFANWLTDGASTTFDFKANTTYSFVETEVWKWVDYFPYSIGYAFGHNVVNASAASPIINSAGQPVSFSSESLAACWIALDHPKCWPMAIPLVAVLPQPTDCERQKHLVQFVDWMQQRTQGLNKFLMPNLDTNEKMGAAEYCKGRSLLRTEPEPQALSASVKSIIYALAGVGMGVAVMQAIALGVARRRSELKSASVMFSLLAVIGVFLILLAPLLIVQDEVSMAKCGSSVWFLTMGFSLCYGSLFAKLFRLYTIFTSRKLVVPRLSNRKLLMMVSVFLTIDFVLLLIYNVLTPPEPFMFSTLVASKEDLVTGYREFTLSMCSFHLDSPVLYIIFIYKFVIAAGGALMAFFIRQVDRRFSATSALGWAFWNMFVTVAIAITISVQFADENVLATALVMPVFFGLWIMYVTLCALTLDSNVLLACRDFSQPLRRFLSPGSRTPKDSKDRPGSPTSKKPSGNGEAEEPDSAKRSHTSTIFVVNREMFPSKYEDFDPQLLDQILQELNFQRAAVRRAISAGPVGAETTAELSSVNIGDRPRGSTKDLYTPRFNSKSKTGLVPLSVDSSCATPNQLDTPRLANGMLKEMLPEPLAKSSSTSTTESNNSKIGDIV